MIKQIVFVLIVIFVTGCSSAIPKGIGYESRMYKTDDIDFFYDLTYEKNGTRVNEHSTFYKMLDLINEAEEFIVMDVFLFNDLFDIKLSDYPAVSQAFVDALIARKRERPGLKIYFLTDEVNTFYGASKNTELERLEKNGIPVVLTDMTKVKSSVKLYSAFWKVFFSWFGTGGPGWLPNPLSPDAPKVTLRGYLKLLNLKGNHRKVLISEKSLIVTSANPHDASSYHSNIGFQVNGNIVNAGLVAEKAVGKISNKEIDVDFIKEAKESGQYSVQMITEKKIGKNVRADLRATKAGDKITLGMFYLGDKRIIKELKNAANRGVNINIILDLNTDAFGMKKIGIPNKVVSNFLHEKTKGKIKIRWYNSTGEQYHTKLIAINYGDRYVINGGSANYTSKNVDGYTLDTNLRIVASPHSKLAKEVDEYFTRLWGNVGATYTLDFKKGNDTSKGKYFLYKLQDATGFSSF